MTKREQELYDALEKSTIALNDWVVTYAAEFCFEDDIIETSKRITENGGTLHYIAEIMAENHKLMDDFMDE